MEAYLPTMLTGQGRAFRDGIFSDASPQTNYQGSVREYGDGSLGHVFRDGSLGAGAPRGPYTVNPLQAKMRLLRSRLSGLGAGAPTLAPNMGSNRRLEYLRALKKLSVRGIGEDGSEDVSVSFSASPTVKVLGLITVLGLGAYGIYRLTKK